MSRMRTIILISCIILSLAACSTQDPPKESLSQGSSDYQSETVLETTLETEPETKVQYEILSSRVDSWSISEDTHFANFIVEFVNTGTCDLRLSDSTYDLEDPDGNLVSAQNFIYAFPDVLQPGEKGYLATEEIFYTPLNSDLKIIPRINAKESTIECIRYNVTDTKLVQDDYESISVIGRVENTGATTAELTYIFVALYNADGVCIDTKLSSIDNLAPGEKVGFEAIGVSSPSVPLDSVADIKCYAYPILEED